jgi:hypothetical protein
MSNLATCCQRGDPNDASPVGGGGGIVSLDADPVWTKHRELAAARRRAATARGGQADRGELWAESDPLRSMISVRLREIIPCRLRRLIWVGFRGAARIPDPGRPAAVGYLPHEDRRRRPAVASIPPTSPITQEPATPPAWPSVPINAESFRFAETCHMYTTPRPPQSGNPPHYPPHPPHPPHFGRHPPPPAAGPARYHPICPASPASPPKGTRHPWSDVPRRPHLRPRPTSSRNEPT